jgi:nucleotide-binding universal stress UspA family protein
VRQQRPALRISPLISEVGHVDLAYITGLVINNWALSQVRTTMRRVLVPLDGSEFAESILPDALRLAAPDGELILIRDASRPMFDPETGTYTGRAAFGAAETYLSGMAAELKTDTVKVTTETFVMGRPSHAIDTAVAVFKPDMIACATHGRTLISRMFLGGVAWRALAHSSVPVLMRHPGQSAAREEPQSRPRQIMVPLDGSNLAEKALPLVRQLAKEWHAPVHLVRVAVEPIHTTTMPMDVSVMVQDAHAYLDRIAATMRGDVSPHVLMGPVCDLLANAITGWSITDVILASHGRSGLSRMVLGSVADNLIHRVHCPVMVVPAFAPVREESREQDSARPEAIGV